MRWQDHVIASLTDAVAVAMEQWSMQHHAFIVETVLKMVTLLLMHSEYFASISILFVMGRFLATVPRSYGWKT
jgi:hypothetical protein